MSGYVKIFKIKDEDKYKNSNLIPFRINDEKLLKKYKAIWTKIEDLKNIEWNALPVYDDRYMKTKIRAYEDKLYWLKCARRWYRMQILYSHLFLSILLLYTKTDITGKYF